MPSSKPLTEAQKEARKLYVKEYNARPEVKARKALHNAKPESIAKKAAYYQRPEVKQKYIDRNNNHDHKKYCKEWRESENGQRKLKDYRLKLIGFNLELWNELMVYQDGCCAICKRSFSLDNTLSIHADHCHDTKVPRGLLCKDCNIAEGFIKTIGLDPIDFANRLIDYLNNPPAKNLI